MNTKMIRTGLVAVALAAVPIAAGAADLTPRYKAPAYVAPAVATWNGFYIGIVAGYGFGTSNWDFPAVNTSPKGFLAGATLGYNLQTGSWVWGIEADGSWSQVKGSSDCFGGTCETKTDWLATGRLRIGYAGWASFLPYVTGGAAGGDIKASSPFGSASKTEIGWTAGAGLEYALWTNWSIKGEYLYVDLGKFDCGASCGAASDNVSFKEHVVRAGVNYRF